MEHSYQEKDIAQIDSFGLLEDDNLNASELLDKPQPIPANYRRKFERQWRNTPGLTQASSSRKNNHITSDDGMIQLMNSIGQYPLLTKDGEVYLAKYIELAKTAEEETESYWQGEWAKEKLTNSNLRLVISIARKYVRKDNGSLFIDMFQEGVFGLMRAVEKFDWHKGFKFSTYATWWIHQSMGRSSASYDSAIRVPIHRREVIRRLNKVEMSIESAGLPISAETIAAASYMDVKEVTDHLMLRRLITTSSMDKPIHDGKGTFEDANFLSETLGQEDLNYSIVEDQVALLALKKVLSELSGRERDIIERRYGLNCDKPETLEAIGVANGVTREAVRQIEKRVLLKLQKLITEAGLEDYVN